MHLLAPVMAGQGLGHGGLALQASLHAPLHGLINPWHPRCSMVARPVACMGTSMRRIATTASISTARFQSFGSPAVSRLQCTNLDVLRRHPVHARHQQSQTSGIIAHASQDSNNSTSSTSSGSGDDPGRRPNPPNRPVGWLQRLTSSLKPQQPLRLLLNLLMLFFLMRIWPVGGRLGLGEGETVVISVPFSEFIKRVKHDDVQTVAIDGMHINFALKPSSIALPGEQALALRNQQLLPFFRG